MNLLFAVTGEDPQPWIDAFAQLLPDATARVWAPGDDAPADFAFVWKPPAAALRGRAGLRAIFNLGAGVDGLLKLEEREPGTLSNDVPLIRVDDAGMAAQMSEYVLYMVLRHFRDFGQYEQQQRRREWLPLHPNDRATFPVAIMGLGELGTHVARTVASLGFPTRGWSRSAKHIDGIDCFAGADGFDAFLDGARVLVSLLPDTPDTRGLIDQRLLGRLAPNAYLINVARGTQVVDADLLAALDRGHLAGAALDVFHAEPLDSAHPFWTHPRVTLTPHISARTLVPQSSAQMVEKIAHIMAGRPVRGLVDRSRGY